MEYEIGDKVELKNGKVVTISRKETTLSEIVYGYGYPTIIVLTKDQILKKLS